MEGSYYHKGWVNKSKIIKHNKGIQPYHVQMLVKDPKKLGLSEKDIINHLTDRYDKMDAPEPKQSAIRTYRDIEQGHMDVDHEVEFLAMEKGWCRFMADECYPMLGGSDWKHLHAAAKKLSDAYPEIFFFNGCSQREMSGELHLFTDKGASSRNWAFTVETFTAWVEGKNPDFRRVKVPKRTEIGSTMAMFRGEEAEVEEDLLNEKPPVTADAMKRYKAGKAGFGDITHLKAKGLIKRSDGSKRKSDKYK